MTQTQTTYAAEIAEWRSEQAERIRRDWVALAGLFWLAEGPNPAGSGDENALVLPAAAPAHIGTFTLRAGAVTFTPQPGVAATVNGEAATERVLTADPDGTPDSVAVGDLSLWVIVRGARVGVRVRDAQSHLARTFAGRRWFDVDQRYRVVAQFVPYDPPRSLAITNILGDTSDNTSPGYALFTLGGHEQRLEATGTPASLIFHFRDATNGKETYGGGRAVRTALGDNGQLVLDFNQAANLPCAFTEYATCPTPPAANRLPVPITAGELRPTDG